MVNNVEPDFMRDVVTQYANVALLLRKTALLTGDPLHES